MPRSREQILNTASLGGKARGVIQRQEALERYYRDPNWCLWCGEIIEVTEGRKISSIREKKFCNKSCAAKFNNIIRAGCLSKARKTYTRRIFKDGKEKYVRPLKERECKTCGNNIIHPEANIKGHCRVCWLTKSGTTANRTKGEINRGALGEHARAVIRAHNVEQVCIICGYSLHVDTCHKIDVQDFLESALVKEINNINNLVYMCKNHHWEFDHGYLKL